jgi:hypothetical protein
MGPDVLSSRDAWRAYRAVLTDERVSFSPEPFALEAEWMKLTYQEKPASKLWTDAYLSAFARAGEMQLVTLDRAVIAMAPEAKLLLPAS